ncbi:hypothetical protein GGI22_004096, partial [Coemansia erecta]
MSGMFTVTGFGINYAQTKRNEGKPVRYSMDDWDRKMMLRDKQLTGTPRGQADGPIAPEEFKTNSTSGIQNAKNMAEGNTKELVAAFKLLKELKLDKTAKTLVEEAKNLGDKEANILA